MVAATVYRIPVSFTETLIGADLILFLTAKKLETMEKLLETRSSLGGFCIVTIGYGGDYMTNYIFNLFFCPDALVHYFPLQKNY